MTNGKLTVAVTLKLSEADAERLDRFVRLRERETKLPLTRGLVLREIVRDRIAELAAEEDDGPRARE